MYIDQGRNEFTVREVSLALELSKEETIKLLKDHGCRSLNGRWQQIEVKELNNLRMCYPRSKMCDSISDMISGYEKDAPKIDELKGKSDRAR